MSKVIRGSVKKALKGYEGKSPMKGNESDEAMKADDSDEAMKVDESSEGIEENTQVDDKATAAYDDEDGDDDYDADQVFSSPRYDEDNDEKAQADDEANATVHEDNEDNESHESHDSNESLERHCREMYQRLWFNLLVERGAVPGPAWDIWDGEGKTWQVADAYLLERNLPCAVIPYPWEVHPDWVLPGHRLVALTHDPFWTLEPVDVRD